MMDSVIVLAAAKRRAWPARHPSSDDPGYAVGRPHRASNDRSPSLSLGRTRRDDKVDEQRGRHGHAEDQAEYHG
jgi:hypothetical protein